MFFIALATMLCSCDKNDEKEITVTPEFLAGTIWKGSLTYNDGSTSKMSISFSDKTNGTYHIKDIKEGRTFTYKLNSNNIKFTPITNKYFNTLEGVWWIDKIKENELILLSDIGTVKETITLTKTFGGNKK